GGFHGHTGPRLLEPAPEGLDPSVLWYRYEVVLDPADKAPVRFETIGRGRNYLSPPWHCTFTVDPNPQLSLFPSEAGQGLNVGRGANALGGAANVAPGGGGQSR